MKAASFLVKGRVQGVGFRYFAAREAQRLGLSGWVRNLHDGNVEVFAEGPEDSLDSLEASLNQGPPWSRVTDCLARPAPFEGCTGFKIKW